VEKFRLLRDMGYDGIELNSPGGEDKEEALRASREVGLPIHGVVDSIHWQDRLSDPDAEVRARGLRGLLTAIEETRYVGGATVLLVPGRNADPETENQQHVWDRSIEAIRTALPLAAKNGVRILIENVWNGFLYDHEGSADQSADRLAAYIDAINSPWVGVYFDIGNHRKYGRPEEWIRTLGSRIVKLDVKDWGRENGWAKIGDGDVDWKQVRAALADIGFSGWATAEVNGGDRERIQEIAERMNEALAL
jgi:hexulose-6-phosphate isomerase